MMTTENKTSDIRVFEIETAISFYIQKGEKNKDKIIENIISYFNVTKEETKKIFSEVEKKFPIDKYD